MSVNPTIIPLSYEQNMIAYYQSLSMLPGFVLLESIDRHYGRYDIVTALPYDVQTNKIYPEIPLQRENNHFSTLPFTGGVIGALSYEYGMHLRGIKSPVSWLNIFQYYDWAIIVDHWQKTSVLYARNQQSDTYAIVNDIIKSWCKHYHETSDITIQRLNSSIDKEVYKKHVLKINEALQAGRCYQVNYTQAFTLDVSTHNPWDLYCQIRKHNPVPYAAFIKLEKESILSFSPERFLHCSPKGEVLTSPIKGSASRHTDRELDRQQAEALLACEKNRAENIMIVDLLRNDLSRVCVPGSVQVQRLMELQSFPAIHHLVSHIIGRLQDGITPLEALLSCFPGGSITGAPKIEAMKIIAELEPFSRGIYCGSIVYFSSHGQMDANIAIRTLRSNGKRLCLSAGGGIVLDSVWEDEYAECSTKLMGILKALHAKSQG